MLHKHQLPREKITFIYPLFYLLHMCNRGLSIILCLRLFHIILAADAITMQQSICVIILPTEHCQVCLQKCSLLFKNCSIVNIRIGFGFIYISICIRIEHNTLRQPFAILLSLQHILLLYNKTIKSFQSCKVLLKLIPVHIHSRVREIHDGHVASPLLCTHRIHSHTHT